MRWPWVSRELLEAAEQARDRALEERDVLTVRLDMAAEDRRKVVEESAAERQKLLDRILEMTGQRPMYREEATPEIRSVGMRVIDEPKQEARKGPVPLARQRITADEIHATFRAAVQAGDVDTKTVRAY